MKWNSKEKKQQKKKNSNFLQNPMLTWQHWNYYGKLFVTFEIGKWYKNGTKFLHTIRQIGEEMKTKELLHNYTWF